MATTFHRGLRSAGLVILASALLLKAASSESGAEAGVQGEKNVRIRVKGSDRMIQLGFAWAEAYHKIKPNVSIDMSGTGPDSPHFSALANNYADICLSVRQMTKDEAERIKSGTWSNR